MTDVQIATRRLLLRRFRPEDARRLAAYRSDPAVARYQSWTPPITLDEAATLVREFAAGDPRKPGWFQYAISRRGDDELIGDLGVRLHDNLMQAEIGYTIGRPYQGHGYATEALSAVVDHLFSHAIVRVSAECDARNIASATLLGRLGFTQEGRRRASTWIKGEWTDDLLFGLLASDRDRAAGEPRREGA
jgi:aminoglycoside 6'-N-acetyltransferase